MGRFKARLCTWFPFLSGFGPYLRDVLAKTRQRRVESEATEFGKFSQAARSGHPQTAFRHLMFWLDRTHRDPGAATLKSFTDDVRAPLLNAEAKKLEAILFDSPERQEQATIWDGREILTRVVCARAHPCHVEEQTTCTKGTGCFESNLGNKTGRRGCSNISCLY